MMKRTLSLIPLAIAATLAAACGFEHHQSNPFAPTSGGSGGDGGPGTSTSSGPMTGTWASQGAVTIPSVSSCSNFSWQISSQSANSLSGNFYAECGGNVAISGEASGVLNDPTTVTIAVSGSALVAGFPVCAFSLSGIGIITNGDTLTIPYSGTTCLGPVQGTETLRRHTDPPPPPPPPPPSSPAPPAANPYHVPPGPLTEGGAKNVVFATTNEFPGLLAVFSTDAEAVAAADQLLLRTIWHLQLAGYQAARQRNPSGLISSDKLNILIGGAWQLYDIFSLGYAGRASYVQFFKMDAAGVNPVASGGIPD